MRKRTGDSGESDAATGDRQFITSLHRGLEVLRAFRPEDRVGLSNGDIADRTGLPNSTISRLTYTLLKTGYLLYDKETGRYRMGVPVLSLGYACLSGVPVRDAAQGYMQELANECGEGVQVALGGRVDYTMTYIAAARSRSVISLQLDVGSRISLARSAMGRAYIAAAPEEEKTELLEGIQKRYDPALWPAIHDGIKRAEDEIATRGFYANIGEWQSGVNAVAVPFQSKQSNAPLLSFNLGGPTTYLDEKDMLDSFGPMLVEMVATLRQSAI
ncbi:MULTISPECIES: IclR family transcriptional regulator [Shimia]|uniref:IclR family transcriptional regulator n=1 Tax=Shimia TaxID=573139 RepID=UPI001FB4C15E|nr:MULTISPECIES: IclR family transcriptional regulator [Shimia]MDV4143601.1 IclR family transcriptional regulator [Shimia sp. FJ5]